MKKELYVEKPVAPRTVEVVEHDGSNESAVEIAEWLASHGVIAWVIPHGVSHRQGAIIHVDQSDQLMDPLLILPDEYVLRDVEGNRVITKKYARALWSSYNKVETS